MFGLESAISKRLSIKDFPTATKRDRARIGYGRQDAREEPNTSATYYLKVKIWYYFADIALEFRRGVNRQSQTCV